jgi:hypothetical protein
MGCDRQPWEISNLQNIDWPLLWASEHRLFVLDIESNWIFYLSGNCPAAVFNANARIKTGIKI